MNDLNWGMVAAIVVVVLVWGGLLALLWAVFG